MNQEVVLFHLGTQGGKKVTVTSQISLGVNVNLKGDLSISGENNCLMVAGKDSYLRITFESIESITALVDKDDDEIYGYEIVTKNFTFTLNL